MTAPRAERADAIRRLLSLAEPGDELTQAEHDIQLLGVDPFELFCAADPAGAGHESR